MRDIDGMAHARVQAGCHQFLLLLVWAKLSFSGKFVSAKFREDAPVNAESGKKERYCQQPRPCRLIKLLRMPWPGDCGQQSDDDCPDWKQRAIGRFFHPLPAPGERMDGKPE